MMHKTAIAITVALLAAAPAAAQMTQDWDTDSSGGLSRDEWTTGVNSSTLFSDWDADANDSVSGSEFSGGLFTHFDADGDSNLTSAEWDDGMESWFGESAATLDFASWDTNGDGMLSQDEFRAGFDGAGLYDTFRSTTNLPAGSGDLSRDDFTTGMYDSMDRNRDDNVDGDENRFQR